MARNRKPSPAFSFYPDDWLGSTAITLMSPAAEGAYIRLLAYQWNAPDCSIPGDDKTLALLSRLGTRWDAEKRLILSCFRRLKSGRIRNERLYQERLKQLTHSEQMSYAGKRGAQKRWQGHKPSHSSAIVEPMAPDSFPSPSPSPSPREGGGAISGGAIGDHPNLTELARAAQIPGRPETVKSYLCAWVARSNVARVTEVLKDPWTLGKTVVEIQDHFFAKNGNGSAHRKPVNMPAKKTCKNPKCTDGKIVDHSKTVNGGTTVFTECPACQGGAS